MKIHIYGKKTDWIKFLSSVIQCNIARVINDFGYQQKITVTGKIEFVCLGNIADIDRMDTFLNQKNI